MFISGNRRAGRCALSVAIGLAGLVASAVLSAYQTADAAPTSRGWVMISASEAHTCGIRADTSLWCWGSNGNGELGDGSGFDQTTPVEVSTGWATVTGGEVATCGIRLDGSLWCWGSGSSGELGLGPIHGQDFPTPQQVGSDTDWLEIAGVSQSFCAVRAPGSLWCWGLNRYGELGLGDNKPRNHPVRVGQASRWTGLSGSTGERVCAVMRHDSQLRGTAWCWGNGFGLAPVKAASGSRWRAISVGWEHQCARRTDASIWCWGDNQHGELGNGTTQPEASPTKVPGADDWVSVTAGFDSTCGLESSGALSCWGRNEFGELGVGDQVDRLVPTRVATPTRWRAVSDNYLNACGIRSNGSGWCWGYNIWGELGDGTHQDANTPQRLRLS
jgi:alpha-tubulin suppressor-like RCC1 family protein